MFLRIRLAIFLCDRGNVSRFFSFSFSEWPLFIVISGNTTAWTGIISKFECAEILPWFLRRLYWIDDTNNERYQSSCVSNVNLAQLRLSILISVNIQAEFCYLLWLSCRCMNFYPGAGTIHNKWIIYLKRFSRVWRAETFCPAFEFTIATSFLFS